MAYTGTSIVDYLKSIGQDSSFASRSTLAQQKGISNYTGSAQQNQQLLGYLNTPNIPASFTPPTNQTYQYPAENTGTNGGNVIAGIQAQLDAITKMAADIQKNGETSSSTNGQPTKPQSLSAAETQQTSLWDKITSAASSILGTKQEVSTMGEQFDLTGQVKAINDNALEMANKMAQYKQAMTDLEGKPIPIENINVEKESLQRKYATDIAVTKAYGEALQGNYARSKSAIDDVIKLKLEPAQQELENLKMFYDMNESILSKEESNFAADIKMANEQLQKEYNAAKDNYDKNVSLYMQIANSGNASQLKNFDFDAPVEQNLVKYGAGLKNVTAGSGSETVVSSNFSDVMQDAINNGATPEQAARVAAKVSEETGIPVNQKQLSIWTEQARKLTPVVIQTQPPVVELSPIEKKIQSLGGLSSADKRYALAKQGFSQKEITNSSVGAITNKIGQGLSETGSFFAKIFGM